MFDFSSISNNKYEGKDIRTLIMDNELDPVEALSVRNERYRCILHREKLQKISLRYNRNGSLFMMEVYFCQNCNRLFISDDRIDSYRDNLQKIGVSCNFYDPDLSEAYLKSMLQEIEFSGNIYIPEFWNEDAPACPIHKEELEALPYVVRYKARAVRFIGYYCEDCDKVLLRRASALHLEDACATEGVPSVKCLMLRDDIHEVKRISPRNLRPDYYIDAGIRILYDESFPNDLDCHLLTEKDTVVVSDSEYCIIEGHDTETVLGMIDVQGRRDGKRKYLCSVGYCVQCAKYYLQEEDYQALYRAGRPDVNVIYDLEDYELYRITSGEVFDLERKHLEEVEDSLELKSQQIEKNPDYVNRYQTGDWIELSYQKNVSKNRKYAEKLKAIESQKQKPYRYRVDMSFAGTTESVYVGVDDIYDAENNNIVVSFNSDYGRELVNTRTTYVLKNGVQYDIKLQREFDIERRILFGYTNIRTDEDLIFREGVTDPFLIKVLNMRKRQHSLTDIIATIQENQNQIVDEAFSKNIIVQGCAGSGKTMVMLHRLSSLKYRYPEMDLSDSALILTPNEAFNTHISGVAEGLQVGAVDRLTIEQYYLQMLALFDVDMVPKGRGLAMETSENQKFVDYIYSNEFYDRFLQFYKDAMALFDDAIVILQSIGEQVSYTVRTGNFINDSKKHKWIVRECRHVKREVDACEQRYLEAKELVDRIEKEMKELSVKLEQTEKELSSVVANSLESVLNKLYETVMNSRMQTETQQSLIAHFNQEVELIKGKTNEEKIAWMKRAVKIVPDCEAELRLCSSAMDACSPLRSQLATLSLTQKTATEELRNAELSSCSDGDKEELLEVEKAMEESALQICNNIFDQTCADFIKENEIKRRNGTRRYDLYFRLLFALKFFGNRVGNRSIIFIDEGQDLALMEYRLLKELNSDDTAFDIFGDVNQLIKPGRGISDWDTLEKIWQAKLFTLNENYRNTNQITKYCNDSFDMSVAQTGVDGKAVTEIARSRFEDVLSELIPGNERIAILFSRAGKHKSLDMDRIVPAVAEVIGDDIGEGRVSLKYVDEVKGIEFDKVFVVTKDMTKNEKYIAYTRALSELILVVDEAL